MKKLAIISIVLLVIGMTTSLTAVALANTGVPGIQNWKLDSETTPAGYQMERELSTGNDGQTGQVNIASGDCATWLADEVAAADVTFTGGKWVANLCVESDWSDCMDVLIGEWDGSTFTAFNTVTKVNFGWNTGVIRVESQLNSETIAEDNYLALQICNLSGTECTGGHTIYTQGCSQLSSPCSDPGYPLPEIAGGILFGLGVVGLAGFLVIRKRKQASAKS